MQNDEYFEDAHGNRILGYYKGMTFSFLGWNATIAIENGTYIKDTYVYMHNQSVLGIKDKTELIECSFSLGDEASLEMDEGVLMKKARYNVESACIVEIGGKCHFGSNGGVILRKYSSLIIGARTSMGKNYMIGIGSDTKCLIGKDCMFANDVCLRTNDGHSIFDVKSQTVINYSGKGNDAEVKIGDHVWVGMRSTILHNTDIGDGSIIGACSLVKCKVPNNVLLYGTPAKIKRKNVAWSRANQVKDIMYCGKENIKLTEGKENDTEGIKTGVYEENYAGK